ncbi:MAG: enoyl-CoA hydratase-related protein, partial [bacterium]
MAYQSISAATEDGFAVVTLNRPDVLNALNQTTLNELVDVCEGYDRDEAVRCIVITGAGRAFAAGADIKEMAGASAPQMLAGYRFQQWERIRKITTPLIAAVNGLALG